MSVYSPLHPSTSRAQAAAAPGPSLNLARLHALPRIALLAGWVVAVLALATFNLERYPATWFDEGSHLHVPKTLVQFGVYADYSIEGFRYFGPTTGVGPTVLLPIAAVFSIAGIGLLQARLVMVVYLLFALIAFALVARRLNGSVAALLASTLLIVTPGVDLLFLGRQVLGEVPALAFLMLGCLHWTRSVERGDGGWRDLTMASLAFALMALTKNQFALILAPTFAIVLLADRSYYRTLRLQHTIIPPMFVVGGAVLGQTLPLLPLMQSGELAQTLANLRQASSGAIFVFSPARILSSLKVILSADAFAFWAVPGLIYGVHLARTRDVRGVQQGFLLAFATVGLAWYAFGSIGWSRYAFPGLTVTALFVGRLLADLLRSESQSADERGRWRSIAVAGLIVILLGSSLVAQGRHVAGARDTSAQLMAAYLDDAIPTTSIVETWEPEIGFLTNHAYHYPPSGWLDRAVRAQWLSGSSLPEYDLNEEVRPAYLLVGKFGKYTGIYGPYLKRTQPPLVASIGEYDLYWLRGRPTGGGAAGRSTR